MAVQCNKERLFSSDYHRLRKNWIESTNVHCAKIWTIKEEARQTYRHVDMQMQSYMTYSVIFAKKMPVMILLII